jgi:hypothetical protein
MVGHSCSRRGLLRIILGACALLGPLIAYAAGPIKVAVTDLAYEERVREYFKVMSATEKSSFKGSSRDSERESDLSYSRRSSGSVNARSESSFNYAEGTYSYIETGELRKFTADVKGEMLKSRQFQVMQGKPYTAKNTEKLYDVIDRIKKGMYPGAEYVLFGSINNIEFRQEANPIDHTDTVSHSLSLELVAEFSLINTRNYQVKAAFSAMGTGQDVKLMSSRGGRVVLNRSKVMSEVSKSLGEDAIRQLLEQVGAPMGTSGTYDTNTSMQRESAREEVIIFR